ncbi:hypothetical protein [Aliiroseovarius sp. YM-037]|uniref:hypothetical protein n=1 Tax=Aliiroseovarius sp. YM-037 TaxID=3341728 RepID=UPI003A80E786
MSNELTGNAEAVVPPMDFAEVDLDTEQSEAVRNTTAEPRPAADDADLRAYALSLADADLFVLVDERTETPASELSIVKIDGRQYTLAFETDDNVSELLGREAVTLALKGRDLFNLVKERDVRVAMNAGDPESAKLLSCELIDWVCDRFEEDAAAETPQSFEQTFNFRALLTPRNFPDTVKVRLGETLSPLSDLFDQAFLLRAEYEDGKSGYLLAVSSVEEDNQRRIADAITTAVTESGQIDLKLDIAMLTDDEDTLNRLGRVAVVIKPARANNRQGLRFRRAPSEDTDQT